MNNCKTFGETTVCHSGHVPEILKACLVIAQDSLQAPNENFSQLNVKIC